MKEEQVLSIVDVISQTTILEKRKNLISGEEQWNGLCPFHSKEETAWLMVSPQRGIFKCFECGRGGDVTTFIDEMDKYMNR